jgi:hypothetical protein
MKQLSSKRESFCRYVAVDGLTPTEAYRKAFNVRSDRKSTATEAASRLMKDSKVTATIEAMKQDIQERIASEIVFDKKRIISELALNMELGRETKQLAASNQAIKLIGSAVGNVFEPEIQQVNGTIEILHQLPDAVLMQLESMVPETGNNASGNNVPSAIEGNYKIVDSEAS